MAATPSNFHGARDNFVGALPLDEAVDVVVGNTATKLVRPANKTVLVLKAVADVWKLKPGDYVSAFPTDPVATSTGTTAGNATWEMAQGETLKIAAPDNLTVKGADADSILKYYWL